MMNFKNLRLWVFLFGVIFLIAAFLFQQSRENRKHLQLQSMISVELTKQNFQETFDNYHSQLNSYFKRKFGIFQPTLDSMSAARMREIFRDEEKDYKIQKIEFLPFSTLKDPPDELVINFIQPDSTWLTIENYVFSLDTMYQIQCDNLKLDEEFDKSIQCENTDSIAAFKISHVVDLYQFMKHNRNNNFFDAIYITDSSGTILYPRSAVGSDLFTSNNLWNKESPSDGEMPVHKAGSRHAKLNISSVDHEVFFTQLKLGNQKFYILGAKESADFDQVALRINFYLLSIFVLGLLFIFVSIPIISILRMDKGDILSKRTVYGAGLSLVLLMVLLGFSFSFGRQPLQDKGYHRKVLEIAEEYAGQIRRFVGIMEQERHTDLISQTNELINFDSKGVIKTLTINGLYDTLEFNTRLFSISNRDYVKQLFIGGNGFPGYFTSAHYSLSTGKLEGVISKKVTEKTGRALTFKVDTFLPIHKNNHRFFIFKENSGDILFFSELLKIPVKNLEEAIGETKWVEVNTLIKNNPDMETDLSWELPLYVNGYEYQGILTRVNLDLFDQSLWVLFLVDQSLEHTKISIEAIEASAFLLAYLFLLILLSLLNSLANKQSIYLNIKTFSYSWAGPSLKKRSWFIALNYILFFDMLFFVILVVAMEHLDIFVVFLLSTLFALHASLSKFILIYPKPGQRFSNIGLFFVLPTLALFFINLDVLCYYLSIKESILPLETSIILAVMVLLLVGMFVLKFIETTRKSIRFVIFPVQRTIDRAFSKVWHQISGEHNDMLFIFAISFIFSAVLVGLIPGYVIHRAVTHHENHIWNTPPSPLLSPVSDPDAEFEKVVRDFERYRRNFFSEIFNQDDTRIADFLAPDFSHLKSYFAGNMDQNPNTSRPAPDEAGLTQRLVNVLINLTFFTVFGALCILVIFLTQRIYLTEYLFTHNRYRLPTACKESIRNFIVSIDNGVAVDWISYHFDLDPDNLIKYDFIEHPDAQDFVFEEDKAIVIQNIHCFKNVYELVTPLVILLNQCIRQKTPLFITSGSSLNDLLDSVGDQNENLRLSEVFSGFISYTIPLNFSRISYNLPFRQRKWSWRRKNSKTNR